MKLTNREILNITSAFVVAKSQKSEFRLPTAIAWKRRVNMTKLFAIRDDIQQMASEIGEDLKKFDELLDQENDVDIRTVRISEIPNISISDIEMDTLEFMIEDEG